MLLLSGNNTLRIIKVVDTETVLILVKQNFLVYTRVKFQRFYETKVAFCAVPSPSTFREW